MKISGIEIYWPNGCKSLEEPGESWIKAANNAGVTIPTGCLGGSCGACEIEINGKMVRACISSIPECKSKKIVVSFASDPFW